MTEFLLEILCDEIPPSLQKATMEQFIEKFKKFNIEITESHYGPRRWTFISEWTKDKSSIEEKSERGPKVDAPEIAIQKFCDKFKIIKEDLSKIKSNNAEYYCYKQITNLSEKEFLIKTILEVLKSITFPKTMDWTGNKGVKWIRPIINILAIFRKEEKFELLDFEFAGVQSSTSTLGHQILKDNSKIDLKDISNIGRYYKILADNFVIVSQDNRRERILLEAREYTGFIESKNQDLIAELVCIAEYPMVMECETSRKTDVVSNYYGILPHKLIEYTMIKNQRYLPLYSTHVLNEYLGYNLTGKFLVVIDHNNPNPIMKQGYERVLNARLDDAKFFWEKMCSRSLEELIELLKTTQSEYIPELSVHDFNLKLVETIKEYLPNTEINNKFLNIISCDLGTEILNEFPALRGIIAACYLLGVKGGSIGKFQHSNEAEFAYFSYYGESELYERQMLFSVEKEELMIPDHLRLLRTVIFFKNFLKLKYYLIEKGESPTGSRDPFGLGKVVITMFETMFEVYLGCKMNPLDIEPFANDNKGFKQSKILRDRKLKNFVLNAVMHYMYNKLPDNIDKKIIELILTDKDNIEEISSFADIYRKLYKFNIYKPLEKQNDSLQAYKRICNLNKKYRDVEISDEVKGFIDIDEYKAQKDLRILFEFYNESLTKRGIYELYEIEELGVFQISKGLPSLLIPGKGEKKIMKYETESFPELHGEVFVKHEYKPIILDPIKTMEIVTEKINDFLDNVRIEVEDVEVKTLRIGLIKAIYKFYEAKLPLEKFLHIISSMREKTE